MYNVPHKYRQVCRLCLTLVNECDIGDLQIYNREAASSNETPKTLHKVNIKQCNIDENLTKCVCNALDPITCCCQGVAAAATADNPLSVMQVNKEISPGNRNPQQKNNYTPSVPSSAAAINANPPCTTTITAETTNVYARMFPNQNQRQQQQYLSTKSNQLQTQEDICELRNTKCLEEQQQQQFVQDNPKSTSSKNVHHEICENTSTNEIYNQEHKDDSSPHITIQIFNCLSIKVRQSCF